MYEADSGELHFRDIILLIVVVVIGGLIFFYGISQPFIPRLPLIFILLFVCIVAGVIVARILERYGFI